MAVSERAVRALGGPADALTRRSLLVLGPGWLALAAVLALSVPGLTASVTTRWWLLLGTAVVLGLPHGALDYVVRPRVAGEPLDLIALLRFGAWYVALVAAGLLAWTLTPALSVVGFLLLTWYHWGQGDRWPLRRLVGADYLADPWIRRGATVVRGGVPIVVPLLVAPARYRAVLRELLTLLGAPGRLSPLLGTELRLALGVGLAIVTVATVLASAWRATDVAPWLVDAGEVALLWAAFAVAPPLTAIAAYFVGWHSLRHVARVRALGTTTDDGDAVSGWTRLRRWANPGLAVLPTTVGALGVLGSIWVATGRPGTPAAVGAVYLVTLSVLTVPHVVLVTWLDRTQGV